MVRFVTLSSVVLFASAFVYAACGTDAVGVDTCRQIESARCVQAVNCGVDSGVDGGVDLSQPPHRNSPTTDVASCQRFYDIACLHGLEATADPGAPALAACLKAINTGDCQTVLHPETNPACAFLIPPPPDGGTDAPVEASSAEGGAGAGDASVETGD